MMMLSTLTLEADFIFLFQIRETDRSLRYLFFIEPLEKNLSPQQNQEKLNLPLELKRDSLMKKKYLILFAFSSVFLLQSCAGMNGTKDIVALQQELKSSDLKVRCAAAHALGGMQHQQSIALLAEMVESEQPDERRCATEALRWYHNPEFCQDFYDIWLSDPDEDVRKAAGMSIVDNECEQNITRRTDYAMDSKTCGYTQYFINNIRDAIAKASPAEEWKKVIPQLNIRETIVDKDTPEEILQMRLNLAFAVIDWGESVANIHNFEDQGSMEETRSRYLSEIEIYTKKQEFVKQFCPIIIFPEFTFWNEVITEEKMQ